MANRRQLDNERPDGKPIEGYIRVDPPSGGGNNDDLDISKDFKTLTLIANSEEKKSKVRQVLPDSLNFDKGEYSTRLFLYFL